MEQETKLVPPSTPVIEIEDRKKTILKFENSSVDYDILSIICGALTEKLLDCKCTIRATGVYNQIEITIEHYAND